VDTWVHHVEGIWEFPDFARFLRRLASFGRLIHLDRRGTGLSDPGPLEGLPDFDEQVEDVVAVLDAAGSERPAIFGTNDGTLVAMLLAAAHPERCSSLALFSPSAKHVPPQKLGSRGRRQRDSVRIGAMAHYYRQTLVAEVGEVLTAIRCPTLVLNRRGNRIVSFEQSEEVAAAIPDATLVELPGGDHLIFSQDIDRVADELEEFLTGARSGRDPTGAWRRCCSPTSSGRPRRRPSSATAGGATCSTSITPRSAPSWARFGGHELTTTGDGFSATFDSPTQAVRCALSASDRVGSLGVTIRAGVHTGEVEIRGDDLGGLAVHIASRVMAAARPGEVLLSGTVKDLLAGSDLDFEDRGDHGLKGVPGTWRLFAVRRD